MNLDKLTVILAYFAIGASLAAFAYACVMRIQLP